ncbi:MAG: PHP-associated domain-containing protein, partial [Elusimicrobiaceae bacterium]|nr:PHP-associated domain-containing protein [Elusimicrobiaceae bacterium]
LAFYALTDHDALPGPECFPANSARPAITAKTDTAIPPGPALPPAPRAIAGVEVSTSAGHIIGLFIDRAVRETEPAAALKAIKTQGGITVIPHPLRPGSGLSERHIREFAPLIDALEIFNPSNTEYGNARAFALARELGKTMVSGSDAHRAADIGRGAFSVTAAIADPQQLKTLLLANRLDPVFETRQLPPTAAQPARMCALWAERCVRALGLHHVRALKRVFHAGALLARKLTRN